MLRDESTPSYGELFGELDFRTDDDARSVYSPAAYLVDLLALLDGTFDRPSLLERRPDLRKILLDAENTFNETPYLDIVNEILEGLVGTAPYQVLQERKHPFGLPFSLTTKKLQSYLDQIQLKSSEFYQVFAAETDHDVVARECLRMSPVDISVVVTPSATEAELTALYGVESLEELRDAERFAEACGLTGEMMRELVAACPPVTLKDDGTSLEWGASVPVDWLDRTHRFVRLARMTGLEFAELGLVVRSCCKSRIDLAALRSLAIVMRLREVHELAIEDICRLVVAVEPEEVQGCSGDILADRNNDYRFRLAARIDVPENDIFAIVRRFREHYRDAEPSPFDQDEVGLPAIGLLRRCGYLASTLGISVDDLFDVLVALDSEPSLRRYTTFAVLGEVDSQRRDVFGILTGGDSAESLWLAQTLFAVVTWMQTAGFGGQELTEILGGRPGGDDGRQEFIDGVNQAFGPVALSPALFEDGRFGTRATKVVYEVLTAYGEGVVAAADDRMLDLDVPTAANAAYGAVTDLAVTVAEDFRGLGLDERLRAKIFTNLVLLGHLDPSGTLTAQPTDGFLLATDFTPHRETLFKMIGTMINGAASFFPSDLIGLANLPEQYRAELYDNLVYNGHIDQDGTLTEPGFFTKPDNAALFEINADLSDAVQPVIALLDRWIARFTGDALALDPEIFASLRFTDEQLTALTESLTFNGHIDENGHYRDKRALATARVADFGLALEFYPQRHAILAAVQDQIRAFEHALRTFEETAFAEIADEVMSRRTIEALDGKYLVDGRIAEQALSGDLDLPGFPASERGTILGQLRVILADQQPYRLDPAALSSMGFTAEERDRLVSLLVAAGYLTDGLAVAEEWLPYFRNVSSAIDFALDGLADHSKDIFFLLHPVAVALDAAITEIVDSLIFLARQQQQALYGALGDVLGVPADAAAAICEAVTGGPKRVFDTLITPVLDADEWPADAHFRLAHRRIRRFARLAAKLGLRPAEITTVFTDQDLAGKFPESLALPPGVRSFDALLETVDGKVLVFAGATYWTYTAGTYALKSPIPAALIELSPRFRDLIGIDAAFTLPGGDEWLIGRTQDGAAHAFTRNPGGTRWAPADQEWGKIKNNFTDPAQIDGAFVDSDNRTYLFSGDQYIRYSSKDYTYVDEGYPRPVTEWQEREGIAELPSGPLDAFQAPDGRIHVLTGTTGWGVVRNAFEHLERLDAAQSNGSWIQLYSGSQVVRYSDCIENDDVRADEGFPRRVSGVPAQFENGVDAAFTDLNGVLHLFKNDVTAAVDGDKVSTARTASRWGVLAPALPSGAVDAALAGLDGKTYLFSGRTYLRYSADDYTAVDVGYPRAIDPDWGGLDTVDAAFTMDGATYLFGIGGLLFDLPTELHDDVTSGLLTPALRNRFAEHGLTLTAITGSNPQWTYLTEQGMTLTVRREGLLLKVRSNGSRYYVRYSGKDYRVPDAGFPKPLSDNWWNMPDGLDLGPVDAVFTGRDNHTYLFSGDRFIRFDARHRWWSEPMSLHAQWDSLPFAKVDAAFVGPDGRTYLFSGNQFVRYSDDDYTEVDDRYPARIADHWDRIRNNIERTGRVDATLVTNVTEKVDGVDTLHTHTYLFSGDQYFRYTGTDYARVQPGYPRLVEDLSSEPGLGSLDVKLDGLDAAFADRRTAYLFRGGQCHAVSAGTYRRYDDLNLGEVTCAFIEDGSVIVNRGKNSWVKRSAIEGHAISTTVFRPRTLRKVPEAYQTDLDSVLTGADGTTYLFKGATCFNTQLNRAYPLAQEWGRPRNTIYQNSRVDAAFVGRDGKTYLFSDDQFVVHPDATTTVEADPQPIAEHWGGLTSVALAYVHDKQTVLFEHPDESGQHRYVVYSGIDYTEPDEGYPAIADKGVIGVPEDFPFPNAVLFERDTMILLSGENCVSRDPRSGRWSIVRPIERLFPGFGHGLDAPDPLRAAFTAIDGATHFFFGKTCTRFTDGAFGPYTPTRDQWGLSRNPFITEGGTIDAAFVWRGEVTYLFSGEKYVRYTGQDYRAIDAGYPKRIAGNLRLEEPFGNLPETFEDALDRPVDAVIGNNRTIHVIIGGVCHTVSPKATTTFPLDRIGRLRNTVTESGSVDAALVADRRVYLLAGDQYVRYSTADYSYVDEGYPMPLGDIAAELGIPQLPVEFQDGIDAAFRSPDGSTYMFHGKQFVGAGAPQLVSTKWGKVRNGFDSGRLDAAFVAPTGELYAFAGDQFVRYLAGASLKYVESGFPRTVKDDWGDLPREFESGPDGAFTFEGRTYLTKREQYVRYSGEYDKVDRTFPQQFQHRWSGTADYRLSDLHTITRFADLAHSGPDGLAELFTTGANDPYQYLGAAFGWDVEEVRWARRNSGQLLPGAGEEKVFEIEFLLRLVDIFAVAHKFGAGPSRIYTEIWANLYRDDKPDAAVLALYAMLERKVGPQDWEKVADQLHNELNVLKRDALLAAVAPRHGDSHDLFRQYLIDVDMGPAGTTSRVREAIAATQLFLHRYLLDLETIDLPRGTDPDEVKAQIRRWWAWMRTYRIWEANRKVFLYPENYLRPELRTQKSPAFTALEEDLLQKEITAETVQAAYKRYLDEYTEVSRLAIAGGYVYSEDDAPANVRKLVLFGRTRTEPRRYYYRSAEFRDGAKHSSSWDPWQRVDVAINAERVDPVHAFGRVFVFWSSADVVAQDEPTTTTITTVADGDCQRVSAPPPKYQVKIYYSFRNLNGDWVPAQLLAADTEQDGLVNDLSLYVQASRTVNGVTHDSIVVQCSYTVGEAPVTSAFTLTPELYGLPASGTIPPARAADLTRIFREPDTTPISPTAVVRFNAPADTTDDPWSSVDHKGGSFLCRPVVGPADPPELNAYPANGDNLPTTWVRVDAAFELADGTRYFFENDTQKYVRVERSKVTSQQNKQLTAGQFGIIETNMHREEVVNAVLVRDEHVYLFSGDEVYRYPKLNFGILDAGYPKKIEAAAENDRLPRWTKIDAAFTGQGGVEVFYSAAKDGFVISGALTTVRPVKDWWSVPAKSKLDTVVQRDDTYLVFGNRYVKLRNDLHVATDYPKTLSGNNDRVTERGYTGPSFVLGQGVVTFDNGKGTYSVEARGRDTTSGKIKDLGTVATAFTTTGRVDATYVADDKLFLVSGNQFVRYTLTGGKSAPSIPPYIDPGYPKKAAQPVGAVIKRGDWWYVFSGDRYGTLDHGRELDTKLKLLPFEGNWRCLPEVFPRKFTGALDSDKMLFLFTIDGYASYPKAEAVPRPYEISAQPTQIVRLTSSTAHELNRRLLVGGMDALLAPDTQELDELPAFSYESSDAGTVRVKPKPVTAAVPVGSHLDFDSSNGLYYWEIFFYGPMLIAQALNDAQRFEDARRWYEYVFDPTQRQRYWRFLPFLAVDVEALVTACRADLVALAAEAVESRLAPILTAVELMAPAFLQERDLTDTEETRLADLAGTVLDDVEKDIEKLPESEPRRGLLERVAMIRLLDRHYHLVGDRDSLMAAYRDDPFDPHHIARLRPSAYRREVVMAYIDNLLDWGDMLFRQYTGETLDEARMLYIFAYDLLGERPYNLGPRSLPDAASYDTLDGEGGSVATRHLTRNGALLESSGAVHGGVANPYFYVPDNSSFLEYWTRVEDRLTKIRASLDIMGISRPVPLFEPPADVMALVRGAAKDASPDQVTAALAAPVPVYKFTFLHRRAQELADRLQQLGNDLLSTFERRDGEELVLLQNRQEAGILALTRNLKENQVQIAEANVLELQTAQAAAAHRAEHYEKLVDDGLLPLQEAQIAMMAMGSAANFVSGGLKIGAAIASGVPQTLIGPFIMGTSVGGDQIGDALEIGAEVSESLAEGLSTLGELLGVRADQERQKQDWQLQAASARSDVAQIGQQLTGAQLQVVMAQRELEILDRQTRDSADVGAFLAGKFAGAQLYREMVGRLSGLYFQTYNLAYELAKAAERAYQFERGGDAGTFIQPSYWESKRNGLLAAQALALDLDRLGQAHVTGDTRSLEITKRISLLQLDPVALLVFRDEGMCEFALTEELFDRDFPGHYRRQIRTVSVSFEAVEGPVGVNATLTQVDNKTVLMADAKAVKYLLDPKGLAPDSIRGDWRPSEQIALSDIENGQDNNGLFDLRYDDDRYLPFEGTGAVSRWRLDARRVPASLTDVMITLKYTAVHGGDTFATAVKGMLRPYPSARYLDVAAQFPDAWEKFVSSDSDELSLRITPDLLPDMTGRQITGVYARYVLFSPGEARFTLNGTRLVLEDGKFLRAPGLTTGTWPLVFQGDKSIVADLVLILTYRAGVR